MRTETCLKKSLALAACLLASSMVWAQADAPATLDGAWSARVKVPATGREYQGKVSLAGGEGSWQFSVKNPNDPCVGLRVPLAWRRTDGGGVELNIMTSKALTGCADSTLVLRQVDVSTLEGRSPSGLDFVLTRLP